MPSHMARATGLSPRVRGNHLPYQRMSLLERSIPACAGEPQRGPPALVRFRVYPRVCGGTEVASTFPRASEGLSPRVRGNRNKAPDNESNIRSIPACAGEPHCRYGCK